MKAILASALKTGTVVVLASSLVACGPDDMQAGGLSHMAVSNGGSDNWGRETLAQLSADGQPFLDALPMSASYDTDYGYAPSWDYRDDRFARFDDGGAQYDRFEGYDEGYAPYDDYAPMGYGDAGNYDSSPGSDAYALLAVAAVVAMVIGDSPPDYGFAYTDAQPWAWNMHDGYTRYAEPVRGGYRYYYYEPNTPRPFLVRDPYYSYGYRGDRVVIVYDRYGRVVDRKARYQLEHAAGNYRMRGIDLYRAGHDRPHVGVPARVWESRRVALMADRRALNAAREKRTEWRQWDHRNEAKLAKRWLPERQIRADAAKRYDAWRKADFRGTAPQFDRGERTKLIDRDVAKAKTPHAKSLNDRSQRHAGKLAAARPVAARAAHDRPVIERRNPRVTAQDVRKDQRPIHREISPGNKADRRVATENHQRQRAERAQAERRATAQRKLASERAQQVREQKPREHAETNRMRAQGRKDQAAERQQAHRDQAQQRQQARVAERQQSDKQQAQRREVEKEARVAARQERPNLEPPRQVAQQANNRRGAHAASPNRQDKARRIVSRD